MILGPPVPEHDPDEVRAAADEILSRAEFAEPGRSVIERFIDWVGRQIDRLFPDSDPGPVDGVEGGAGGSSLFTVVLLVVAVVAVVLLVRALAWTWGRRRPTPAEDLDVDVEGRRSAAAWDELARRLEADGRWKEAMRARFGALVERLVEEGVVDDTPGRTTGEYRAEVRVALPDVGEDFAAAADLFDRAWYGDLPTGPDEAARFVAGAERVLTAAGVER